MEHSETEYVFLVDVDFVPMPHIYSKLLRNLGNSSEVRIGITLAITIQHVKVLMCQQLNCCFYPNSAVFSVTTSIFTSR